MHPTSYLLNEILDIFDDHVKWSDLSWSRVLSLTSMVVGQGNGRVLALRAATIANIHARTTQDL